MNTIGFINYPGRRGRMWTWEIKEISPVEVAFEIDNNK